MDPGRVHQTESEMTVRVVKSGIESRRWCVKVIQGVQSFTLDYYGTKAECLWMASMFRKAIKAHNEKLVHG